MPFILFTSFPQPQFNSSTVRVASHNIRKHTRFYITKKNHDTTSAPWRFPPSPPPHHLVHHDVPLQHHVRRDRPHRNIICDHPATWFGQIRSFFRRNSTVSTMLFLLHYWNHNSQEDGNNSNVSWFLLEIIPHPSICIFAWCDLCSDSFLCPTVWSFISLDENSSLCKQFASQKLLGKCPSCSDDKQLNNRPR